jgi:hypothetical protein
MQMQGPAAQPAACRGGGKRARPAAAKAPLTRDASYPAAGCTAPPGLQVHASIFSRIVRVIRSYISNLVGSLEDPEVMLIRISDGMQQDAARMRQVRGCGGMRQVRSPACRPASAGAPCPILSAPAAPPPRGAGQPPGGR